MIKIKNTKPIIQIKNRAERTAAVVPFLVLAAWLCCLQISCREAASHDSAALRSEHEREQANLQKVLYGKSLLKDGDLVLRTGKDFISMSLRQFSVRDKTYSHCGLVRIEDGHVYVYHAIGGEDNPDARLRRDSFEAFCNPEFNSGFGIFTYQLNRTQHRRLDSLMEAYYQAGIRFDLKFDLHTDSSFYCAEFVYKSVERATHNTAFFSLSHIGHFRYVAIDNLFLTPYARPVYQTVFR